MAQAKTVEIPQEFLDLLARSRLSSLDEERRVKAALALHLFVTGEISAGKTAELIGLPLIEFHDLLRELDIPLVVYGLAEYEQDKAAANELIKKRQNTSVEQSP
jgi:predicted HTH domain antitoxin